MNAEKTLANSVSSNELVRKQLQKILNYSLFKNSDILQNFLRYIIDETLSGRRENIKEYTIALDVLNKPASFRPLADGVVRVHARRLRDALHDYYLQEGTEDLCIITIPKGRYMPLFEFRKPMQISKKENTPSEKIRIAFLPFSTTDDDISRLGFSDSLGMLLSDRFSAIPKFSVISYYSMQRTQAKIKNIQSLCSYYGARYVCAGVVEFESDMVRVSVQLINTETEIQTWSHMYQFDCSASNYFQLSDIIASRVMDDLLNSKDVFNDYLKNIVAKNYTMINKKSGGVLSRTA